MIVVSSVLSALTDSPEELWPIGAGAVLLGFVFRTLWRQETSWQKIVEAERAATNDARLDAQAARDEAQAARTDAAAARIEAARAAAAQRHDTAALRAEVTAAWAETSRCEEKHRALEVRHRSLERQSVGHAARIAELEATVRRLMGGVAE